VADSPLSSSFLQATLWKVRPAGTAIRVVVIHDMEAPEGPTTAENCQRFFAGPTAGGSAHYCVDTDSVAGSVHEEDSAAQAPGTNTDGIGVELCGYARQSREDWLDAGSAATCLQAAALVREIGERRGIPMRWLTDDQLRDGHSKGLTTHAQVTRVFQRGDHTDPGEGFPADVFLELVNGPAAPTTPTEVSHMYDTLTLPDGRGVEFACVFGTVTHRWETEPGAEQFNDWRPITAAVPPSPIVSVSARVAKNGGIDLLCWDATGHRVRAWQRTAGATWDAWLAV
jgi:N-acetyl-anhydromuramyl-L-alanine amidase AmpD